MSGREHRRDIRFKVRLPATMMRGKEQIELLSEDVSFRGIFLRTDDAPPLRQLIKIRMNLPPQGGEITLHGMVVHSVPPGIDNRVPGVGIQFFALGAETQETWHNFVQWIREHHPETMEQPLVLAPNGAQDAIRRKHPRFPVAIKIKMHTVQQLYELYTRDISKGGVFVETAHELAPGLSVKLIMIHPKTGGEFRLDAIVRRRVLGPVTGLGLEFVGLDDVRRDAFFDFISEDILIQEAPSTARAAG